MTVLANSWSASRRWMSGDNERRAAWLCRRTTGSALRRLAKTGAGIGSGLSPWRGLPAPVLLGRVGVWTGCSSFPVGPCRPPQSCGASIPREDPAGSTPTAPALGSRPRSISRRPATSSRTSGSGLLIGSEPSCGRWPTTPGRRLATARSRSTASQARLLDGLAVAKPRKPTRPSGAARTRRLQAKRRRSETKRGRGRIDPASQDG